MSAQPRIAVPSGRTALELTEPTEAEVSELPAILGGSAPYLFDGMSGSMFLSRATLFTMRPVDRNAITSASALKEFERSLDYDVRLFRKHFERQESDGSDEGARPTLQFVSTVGAPSHVGSQFISARGRDFTSPASPTVTLDWYIRATGKSPATQHARDAAIQQLRQFELARAGRVGRMANSVIEFASERPGERGATAFGFVSSQFLLISQGQDAEIDQMVGRLNELPAEFEEAARAAFREE